VSDVVHSVGAFAGRGGTSLEDDCTIVALELQPVVVSAPRSRREA
jgi:hypothetical protein